MQQIPSTYPPFAFQPTLHHYISTADQLPLAKLQGNSINYWKKQSILPEDKDFRKRLQIFKQYKVKPTLISESDDTVVYKKRRFGVGSQIAKEVFEPDGRRQLEQSKKLNRYGSRGNISQKKSRRRQKIFSSLKVSRPPKYQLSIKSMHQSQEDQLITTQRLRSKIQKLLPVTLQLDPKTNSLFSAKTENKSTNNKNNVYSRTPSLEKFDLQRQNQLDSTPIMPQKLEVEANLLSSPKKITFTYQNPTSFTGFQQLMVPVISNSNSSLFGSEASTAKLRTKTEELALPQSLVEYPVTFKESTVNSRSYNQKKTVDFVDRSWNNKTKRIRPNKQVSWGNKIRTELMGVKAELEQKPFKNKEFGSSKVSLNQVKQSLMINGEKISRQNLKINESASNVSEDQSSKRYFDEDIEVPPQVKKISYNNIEMSREQSHHEQAEFKPNQLLLEFQTHKFQSKGQEIIDILDVSPIRKSAKTNQHNQEPVLQESILLDISEEIKPEKIIKQTNKIGKLFPIVLILLAALLFLIQALV